jgi:hypothetical protein
VLAERRLQRFVHARPRARLTYHVGNPRDPMPDARRTIAIEPLAPEKPPWGAPCNGCGVCCLSEPCPVGAVLSRRRQGVCVALHWDEGQVRYHCGALVQPGRVLRQVLPEMLRPLAGGLAPLLAYLALRGIAVGTGCDCDLQVERPVDGDAA